MNKDSKGAVNKIQIPLLMMVFFFTLALINIKPNLNYATESELDLSILGIGTLKASQIIKEREDNGIFKNRDDFYVRVVNNKKYKVGDVVAQRIFKKYKIGE